MQFPSLVKDLLFGSDSAGMESSLDLCFLIEAFLDLLIYRCITKAFANIRKSFSRWKISFSSLGTGWGSGTPISGHPWLVNRKPMQFFFMGLFKIEGIHNPSSKHWWPGAMHKARNSYPQNGQRIDKKGSAWYGQRINVCVEREGCWVEGKYTIGQ